MTQINHPLNNTQLEILKAFSHQLNEVELKEFKNLIAHFFAKRAIRDADEIWDKEGWSDHKVDNILKEKVR